LIVKIETTPATTPDDNIAKVVHESFAEHDLLPAEHLVDKGYTDSHMLVESKQQHGVRIVGPVADDPSWQARSADGFDKSQFVVDWDLEVVTCPAGKQSISRLPNTYPKNGCVWRPALLARIVPHARCALASKARMNRLFDAVASAVAVTSGRPRHDCNM
jgi:transposase